MGVLANHIGRLLSALIDAQAFELLCNALEGRVEALGQIHTNDSIVRKVKKGQLLVPARRCRMIHPT